MHLKLVSAGLSPTDRNAAYTIFEFTVPPSYCNLSGNLHGGSVATVFDVCTSLTIFGAAREGFWDVSHVSRTLNTTYLRPAPEGIVLLVESETVHLGKSMGMIKSVMKRKSDGAVCYTCEHGKVSIGDSKL
jgi:acyl-coenzyme A thioesterase 13